MNKYQYGLDYLVGTSYMTYSCDKNELTHHKAQIDLQELVELHTTKKPISIGLFEKTQNCPNCKSFIDEPMASYIKETHCWKCGQALDWSE